MFYYEYNEVLFIKNIKVDNYDKIDKMELQRCI